MKNEHTSLKLRIAYQMRFEPEAQRRLAEAYWHILLLLLGVSLLSSIGFGYWQFQQSVITPQDPGVKAQLNLSRTDLQNILKGLEARAERFETLRTAPGSVKDPS